MYGAPFKAASTCPLFFVLLHASNDDLRHFSDRCILHINYRQTCSMLDRAADAVYRHIFAVVNNCGPMLLAWFHVNAQDAGAFLIEHVCDLMRIVFCKWIFERMLDAKISPTKGCLF